jgi:hypothetical protein
MTNVVERSILEGPNGEYIFNMVEDVTDYEKTARIIRTECDGFSKDKTRRMNVSVPPRLYYFWANKLGEECWLDKDFLKSFMKENPQYATSNTRI